MKAKTYCLIIFFMLLSVSCSNNKNDEQNNTGKPGLQNPVILPGTFYKRMEGNIDNKYNVVMNLVRIDTVIKGFYYYQSSREPIPFSMKSNMNNNGDILIEEGKGFDNNYNQVITGIFKGKFISDREFKGTWTKPASDKVLNFSLIEKYPEGSAQFDVTNYTSRKKQNDSTHKGFAEIHITFPSIKNFNNKSIQGKINAYLESSLLEKIPGEGDIKKYESYDAMISDFFNRYNYEINESKKMDMPRDIYFQDYFLIDILNNSGNIISFRQTTSIYEGGAHPNTLFAYKNYNLKTGKEIKLSDVFSGNYLPVLTKIAEKKFRKFYDVSQNESLENAGFWFDKGIFRLNDNYSFNTFAVTFQFNSYEVAAYAMGAPEIIIPYSEIKSIIRPDGLLGKFIK